MSDDFARQGRASGMERINEAPYILQLNTRDHVFIGQLVIFLSVYSQHVNKIE